MSTVVETVATTVGGGLVLGSFTAGAIGVVRQLKPTRDEISNAGYVGGIGAVGCILWDVFRLVLG